MSAETPFFGFIRFALLFGRYHRERKFRAGTQFAAGLQIAFGKTENTPSGGDGYRHYGGIPRQKRVFEFNVIQPRIHRGFAVVIRQKRDGRLRQHFQLNHARHDRIAGKVSLQEKFEIGRASWRERVLIQV